MKTSEPLLFWVQVNVMRMGIFYVSYKDFYVDEL